MNPLEQAIENLYTIFVVYPFRPNMSCCIPHCFEQHEIDALGNKPLRQLSGQDLGSFTFSLLLTCGEVEDLKYFLPRLLELVSLHQTDWVDEALILEKLHRAEFANWSGSEQQAVHEFLEAWWWLEISSRPKTVQASFAALCASGEGVLPYLHLWRSLETETSALALAEFILDTYTQVLIGKRFNSHMQKHTLPELLEFFRDPQTRTHLEKMYFLHQHDEISVAEQLLA
jgi:hypothetical protein